MSGYMRPGPAKGQPQPNHKPVTWEGKRHSFRRFIPKRKGKYILDADEMPEQAADAQGTRQNSDTPAD